ncbi:serine/threonine-protein kinase [Streptomyces sp. NBC_00306]|uniref:serine/threonine-protein kinase n=1 Tax=Streptomyces sp. NBC_00306 TaxID=2975708 RepID=UPI002E2C2C68|nr:serine/threonine-protein kinase [Streptomyces sp. NBC_00306]
MDTRGAGRRIVDGRFELLGRLGSGGMGTVWRARDIVLHREVALKEVRPADPAVEESDPARARMLSERVLREARALARIAHPHVVTIFHIVDGPEVPYPWIVMELVDGESLHDRLTRGPLTVPEALGVGRGVLSALRAAHGAGIQHRDVKPANVLLRRDGSPVLTDFGIAALRESAGLTATGDLIGSPEYIAPERIRGEEGNPASDLWSLGMLLYVALEGTHPLRRGTSLSTLVAVLDEPIPPPVRSGALAPVLNALLVRDTAARPDAERLAAMLDGAAREVPGGAPPPPAAHSYAPPHNAPSVNAAPGNVPSVNAPSVSAVQDLPPGAPLGTFGPPHPSTLLLGHTPQPATGPQAAARRPERGRRIAVVVGAAAAITAVSLLLFQVLPGGGDGEKDSAGKAPAATGGASGSEKDRTPGGGSDTDTGTEQPDKAALPPSQKSADLLTPAGVREVIKALETTAHTTKFFELVVYEEYAIAQVPVKGSRKKYDRYEYRDGRASKQGPGGTVIGTDEGPVDVSKVTWDKLPTLISRANRELGISEPTMRYVIVRGPVFEDVPTVNVYLTDDYSSSGYLAADFKGTVLNKVAAEN